MRPLSPRQAAQVDNLELLGPTFKGRTASVSFRLDVIGITRAMAEREWGADAAVAEGGAPPLGGVGWAAKLSQPQAAFDLFTLLPELSKRRRETLEKENRSG